MTKVMLVEDDNNLREIYGARLLAEGYEIVSAKDGEEALALAVKEKPDLIISDIMMPKISGFDMLDILRSTAETKNTKVIMMTALSQAEDKERADHLGADRYLIKSQVTLEDVAKAAREVLGDSAPTAAQIPESPATPAPAVADNPVAPAATATTPAPAPAPVAVPATPATSVTPVPTTPAPTTPAPAPVTPAVPVTPPAAAAAPTASVAPVTPAPAPAPVPTTANNSQLLQATANALDPNNTANPNEEKPSNEISTMPQAKTSVHTKVINPINDISQKPDLQSLLAKEEAKEAQMNTNPNTAVVADVPPVDELEDIPAATAEPTTLTPESNTPTYVPPESEELKLPTANTTTAPVAPASSPTTIPVTTVTGTEAAPAPTSDAKPAP